MGLKYKYGDRKKYPPRYLEGREQENRINEFRLDDGYTLQELADECGVGVPFMHRLSQGMESPFVKGKVRECVEIMCILFNASLSELFPFDVCELKMKERVNYLTPYQMDFFLVGEYTSRTNEYHDLQELRKVIRELLPKIKYSDTIGKENDNEKRNRKIFKLYFWDDLTYKEIGEIFDLTGTMVRFIISKILRKLRHPTKSRKLREYHSVPKPKKKVRYNREKKMQERWVREHDEHLKE